MGIKVIVGLVLLLISYLIKTYIGLSIKTYRVNCPALLRNTKNRLIGVIIWLSLGIVGSILLYDIDKEMLGIGLMLYFLLFPCWFKEKLINYFGGEKVFPKKLHRWR